MSKGDGPKVYDYLLTLHMGWCHGPVDRLNQLWIKDKRAFCGSVVGRKNLCIDQPDLFGGDEKEGGISGVIEYYPGTEFQTVSEEVARRVGRTADRMPGYRKIMHMFFRGQRGLDQGFKWVTNNPYMPATAAHLTRIPRQLNAEHAVIWPLDEDDITNEDGDWSAPTVPTDETQYRTIPGAFHVNQLSSDFAPSYFPIVEIGESLCDDGEELSPNSLGKLSGFLLDENGNIVRLQAGSYPTFDEIDLGGCTLNVVLEATFSTLDEPQFGLQVVCYGGTFDEETGEWTRDETPITGPQQETLVYTGFTSGTFRHELTASIYPGTRFVAVGGLLNYLAFAASMSITEQSMELVWQKAEYGHCAVDEGGLEGMPDANPAHIIYECMTDEDWGKGEDPMFLDVPSFLSVAEVLYDERFGLSLGWFKSDSIEAFIQEILDHIKAFLYQHPSTGLWKLRLLRDDYDAETLPWLTPSNCTVRNPKRQLWGETINEIVATYTDPNTEEEATVTRHNLANIAVQGIISSDPRNYYGVRNERLATRLADRDVIESGTPLWSAQIEVDRSFWNVEPGDCFRLNWPEEGIELMIVRVMSMDTGTPKNRKITLNVTEDIFGVDVLAFTSTQRSEHTDPRPAPVSPETSIVMPPPLPEMLRMTGSTNDINDDRFPEVPVMVMVPQTENRAILDIEVRSGTVRPDGVPVAEVTSVVPPVLSLLSDFYMPPEAFTTVVPLDFIRRLGRGQLDSGSLLMIGSTVEGHEIVQLTTYDPNTRYWTLKRGIHDTVPRTWPIGSRFWVFPGEEHRDGVIRQAETEDSFWMLPRTSRGRLGQNSAVRQDVTISARPYLPFRPADCQIDGEGFRPVFYPTETLPTEITATWVTRNRWSEDADTIAWSESAVTPEADQTVTLRVVSVDGDVLGEYTGLTGGTYDIPTSIFTEEDNIADVQFWSERDGFDSLQFHAIRVTVLPAGWSVELPPPSGDPALIDLTYVPASYTLSDGDTRAVQTGSGSDNQNWVVTEDPITPGLGRHYWEVTFERTAGGDANGYLGIVQEAVIAEGYTTANPVYAGMFGWRGNGALWGYSEELEEPVQLMTGLPTYADGDILMFAFDAGTGFLWLGKNGVWVHDPDYSSPTYTLAAAVRGVPFRGSIQGRANGDGGTLAGASGDFTYALPATCRALKTPPPNANLVFYGSYTPPAGSETTLTFTR